MYSDITLPAWNPSWWENLHCGNQKKLQIRESPSFGESPVLWSSPTPTSHSHQRQRVFFGTERCKMWLWPLALRTLNDLTWTSRHERTCRWDWGSAGGLWGRAAHVPITPRPRDPCPMGSRWRRDVWPEEKTQERKPLGKNSKGWLWVMVQIQDIELRPKNTELTYMKKNLN